APKVRLRGTLQSAAGHTSKTVPTLAPTQCRPTAAAPRRPSRRCHPRITGGPSVPSRLPVPSPEVRGHADAVRCSLEVRPVPHRAARTALAQPAGGLRIGTARRRGRGAGLPARELPASPPAGSTGALALSG